MSIRTLTPDQVMQVYRYLLVYFSRTGHPPSPDAMQRALDFSADAAEQALNLIEERGDIYRDPTTREIVAAYPFSAVPTDHIVRFGNGHSVYSMCAIDALGMPVMLDCDATIESRCAHCGKAIRVVVKQDALVEYAPSTTKVLYMQADACCVPALEQCPSINFFCSIEHLSAWRMRHPEPRGQALDLEDAFDRGRAVFGDLLNVR